MRNSKGAVEIQFNWIFVIIVGSILLLFFYSIVKAQQKSSDTDIGYQTAVDLNTIFNSALESTGTLNIIKIPDTTIDFTCYEYWINNVNKPFNEKIVFSPNRLQGKRLMTWAVDWHAPFKITNFLFITNPEVRYIIMKPGTQFTSGDDIAEEFYDLLPDELNHELGSEDALGAIHDKNDYKTRLVYFRGESYNPESSDVPQIPNELRNNKDKTVTAIVIAANSIQQTGEIYFFEKEGNLLKYYTSFPFLMHETALGAMFAENEEVYECAVHRAFEKMQIVSKVYWQRTEIISKYYNDSLHPCRDSFYPSRVKTNYELVNDMVTSGNYASGDFTSLFTNINSINQQNRVNIAESCARVY